MLKKKKELSKREQECESSAGAAVFCVFFLTL